MRQPPPAGQPAGRSVSEGGGGDGGGGAAAVAAATASASPPVAARPRSPTGFGYGGDDYGSYGGSRPPASAEEAPAASFGSTAYAAAAPPAAWQKRPPFLYAPAVAAAVSARAVALADREALEAWRVKVVAHGLVRRVRGSGENNEALRERLRSEVLPPFDGDGGYCPNAAAAARPAPSPRAVDFAQDGAFSGRGGRLEGPLLAGASSDSASGGAAAPLRGAGAGVDFGAKREESIRLLEKALPGFSGGGAGAGDGDVYQNGGGWTDYRDQVPDSPGAAVAAGPPPTQACSSDAARPRPGDLKAHYLESLRVEHAAFALNVLLKLGVLTNAGQALESHSKAGTFVVGYAFFAAFLSSLNIHITWGSWADGQISVLGKMGTSWESCRPRFLPRFFPLMQEAAVQEKVSFSLGVASDPSQAAAAAPPPPLRGGGGGGGDDGYGGGYGGGGGNPDPESDDAVRLNW